MIPDATLNPSPPRRRSRLAKGRRALAISLVIYLLTTYGLMPLIWRWGIAGHPAIDDVPRITHTKDGIPGDPLNLALIATEDELIRGMLAADWRPVDPTTWRSSLRIARRSVLRQPYDTAPVSDLFVWGRKHDLAFQQPVGNDPRRRHHVRYWRSDRVDEASRPIWAGAVTFDTRVGFSHMTGQITHHIDADVDAERDKLLADLRRCGALVEVAWWERFQPRTEGRNGGGDRYHTDGRLPIGVLGPVVDSDILPTPSEMKGPP